MEKCNYPTVVLSPPPLPPRRSKSDTVGYVHVRSRTAYSKHTSTRKRALIVDVSRTSGRWMGEQETPTTYAFRVIIIETDRQLRNYRRSEIRTSVRLVRRYSVSVEEIIRDYPPGNYPIRSWLAATGQLFSGTARSAAVR